MDCLIIGNHTQGLGIIRSLSRRKIDIHLISEKHLSLSRFSRYLNKYHVIRRGCLTHLYKREYRENLLKFLFDLVPDGKKCVVFGVNEDITSFLYDNKKRLSQKFFIPDNSITKIIDKYRFSKEVENVGLLTPKTYILKTFEPKLLSRKSYVCKGRIGDKFRNISNIKGFDIKNTGDLLNLRNYISGFLVEEEVLLQEKIKKNEEVLHCCGFAVKGKIHNRFQYVKIRQHPDEFGTGTFLKSVKDDAIHAQTASIIDHLSYTGIFEIEYIRGNDGNYYVIEMNPRTWKSINFATDCGQNICNAYYDYMNSSVMPEGDYTYSVGKTWVDLGSDIPMLIKNRQFRNFGYTRNAYYCVLNRKDPMPFVMEILLAPLIAMGI